MTKAQEQKIEATVPMSRLELLRMARIGLKAQLEKVEVEIIGFGLKAPKVPGAQRKRKKMSAAGRERIGAASRKRWKEFRRQKVLLGKKAPK